MEQLELNPDKGFRIGRWDVRPIAGEIVSPEGETRHLEPKVMDVLVELARAHPNVLEREDAIRIVWQGRPVADDGLARCIAALRKALDDSRSQPQYIQTVPKRGYRLISPVSQPGKPELSNAAAEDTAGSTIPAWNGPTEFDQLKILRLLGRGTMGVVHLAQETHLERLVAVKTLRGVIAGDDRAQKRFQREASAAARIDHPNVTRVYRLGQLQDSSNYIVMQYVRGRSLKALATSSEDFSRTTALTIIQQIASALAAAHRVHVIHRDIKPANVLIEDESGCAFLTDFGIAGIQDTGSRVVTRLTLHGEMLGDARYISPEQAAGEPATPASDIYSLGIVAYELLAGRHPYEESQDLIAAHIRRAPPPLDPPDKDDVSPGFEGAVLQALAKDPLLRPTATDFLARLDGISASANTPGVRTKQDRQRLGRASRFWKQGAIALGLLVLALYLLRN